MSWIAVVEKYARERWEDAAARRVYDGETSFSDGVWVGALSAALFFIVLMIVIWALDG